MGIVNSKKFYELAFLGDYAIGGFQAYDMEMIQGIIAAAAETQSPVIVQASCRALKYAGAEMIYQITRIEADKNQLPIVLHLDHGESVDQCRVAVDAGFSSVMLDCGEDSWEKKIEKTREAAQYVHEKGAVLEGEAVIRGDVKEIWITFPEMAAEFVERTECDSLSICVGNSHALYGRGFPEDEKPYIRMELLKKIHQAVPHTPLVLHSISVGNRKLEERLKKAGGRNRNYQVFSVDEIWQAMKYGVVKCNVGTNKLAMTVGVREKLIQDSRETDPRVYLGAGRDVIREAVENQIRTVFLSDGKLTDSYGGEI